MVILVLLESRYRNPMDFRTKRKCNSYLIKDVLWQCESVGRNFELLTHWGRVTHICIGNVTIIGSDNGLSPGRHEAIIWTNDWIMLTGPLGTNFSEISIGIQTFALKKIRLKMLSAKCRAFCLGLNVLIQGPMQGFPWIVMSWVRCVMFWKPMFFFMIRIPNATWVQHSNFLYHKPVSFWYKELQSLCLWEIYNKNTTKWLCNLIKAKQ